MKINKIYKDLYKSSKRYFLITGGRNSGKSFAVSDFCLRLSYQKGQRILYTRYTLTSAELSIIPEFIEKITLNNAESHFEITKSEIINKLTGSVIIFKGIKTSSGVQTANLKSLNGITTWVVDEAEELTDETIFDKIDLSIRSVNLQNRIILILNPTDKTHWIWNRWFENSFEYKIIDNEKIQISTNENVCHIHTTYFNNLDNIPADYLANINDLKQKNRLKYRKIILGEWFDYSDDILFKSELLNRFNLKELDLSINNQCLGAIDTKLTGEDYFCFIVANLFDKKVYISDVIFTQKPYNIALPKCESLIVKHKPLNIAIETNAAGVIFYNQLKEKYQNISFFGKNSSTKKESRIIFHSQFILDNFVFRNDFLPGSDYDFFMKNICSYKENGKNGHDDAPDCCALLSEFVRRFL